MKFHEISNAEHSQFTHHWIMWQVYKHLLLLISYCMHVLCINYKIESMVRKFAQLSNIQSKVRMLTILYWSTCNAIIIVFRMSLLQVKPKQAPLIFQLWRYDKAALARVVQRTRMQGNTIIWNSTWSRYKWWAPHAAENNRGWSKAL